MQRRDFVPRRRWITIVVLLLAVMAAGGCSGPITKTAPSAGVAPKQNQEATPPQTTNRPPDPPLPTPRVDKEKAGPPAPPSGPIDQWYYNPVDKKLVVMAGDLIPPVEKDGKKYFKAYVFSCGACNDESKRFVGYYEGFRDDVKKKQEEMQARIKKDPASVPPEEFYELAGGFKGRLISLDCEFWVDSSDPKAGELLATLNGECAKRGGGQLRPCYPGQKK